jgi:hypothetical protein
VTLRDFFSGGVAALAGCAVKACGCGLASGCAPARASEGMAAMHAAQTKEAINDARFIE